MLAGFRQMMTQVNFMNKEAIDSLYQGYLTKVYQHTQGYICYSKTELESFKQHNISQTYGELLYPSVQKMLSQFNPQPEDIFLDLGSGLGKCALQAFMQTPVKKVIGIEAADALFAQAIKVREQAEQDFPFFWDNDRTLSLRHENFLTADWQGATLVYTCSTCFTQSLLAEIGRKINQETCVQQVISLRPLPTLTRLPLKSVISVECSWDSSLGFHYGQD